MMRKMVPISERTWYHFGGGFVLQIYSWFWDLKALNAFVWVPKFKMEFTCPWLPPLIRGFFCPL